MSDEVSARLKRLAEAEGTSVTRTARRLLEEALGMKPRPRGRHREELEAFFGVWSQEEAEAFRRAAADFDQVDDQDWR
ncbi:MAG TPA: hypothetical protein ENK19_11570 [Acidobacteria bacterium]|nr:hypothetical protein [Acidobacteriota bacterium]